MSISHSVHSPNKAGWPQGLTLLVWACAVASMVYWGLQLLSPATPARASVALTSVNERQDVGAFVARAVGHTTSTQGQAETAGSQLKLMGVVASASGQGSALISIDGQAPKAYRAGQQVHDGWTLASLSGKQITLKSGNTQLQLALPSTDKP